MSFPGPEAVGQGDPAYGRKIIETDSSHAHFDFIILIHSSHRCGFCRKLRADFQEVSIPENLKVIFVEYDTPADQIVRVSETYRNADVYLPDPGVPRDVDFFPTAFVINTKTGERKKYKGYRKDLWEKMVRKTQ
jgi:hypothetical protein